MDPFSNPCLDSLQLLAGAKSCLAMDMFLSQLTKKSLFEAFNHQQGQFTTKGRYAQFQEYQTVVQSQLWQHLKRGSWEKEIRLLLIRQEAV